MKGASNPGKEWVGEVSLKHVYEIALIKQTVSVHPIHLAEELIPRWGCISFRKCDYPD